MDLSAVRSICTCEHCGKFYESPIKLPCFNTICLAHLNELLKSKSKNVIQCCFCKKDHQIPANGFERYTKIDKIIQSKSHLYEDEKEFALFIETSTRKIKELSTELDSKQPDILEIVIKRLSNLRNQIELDAARHKKNIDLEFRKIVKKLELFQEKCIKSVNETYKIQNEQFLKELNEKFNEFKCSPKFGDEQIKSLKKNVEKSLKVMEKKLLNLDRVKESVINLSYKSNNLRINGICFGKIEEKHRSFKIITSSYDNTIGFWENETCLQTLMQQDMTRSLEVYNSKLLITGLKAEIKFWNIDDNMSLLKTVSELNLGYVSCLLATLEGDLIEGFGNGTIKIFNLKTFVCVKTLKDHLSHVWCIILFGSDKFISSSSDRKINFYVMETGNCEKSFENNDSVNCLALYGNNIISGDDNGLIKIWNLNGECEILNGHNSYVFTLDVLVENGLLISSDGIGYLKIWNIRTLVCIRTLKHHKDFISHLKFVDNQRFISISADGTVKLWDLTNLERVKILIEHDYGFRCGKILYNF